MKKLFVMALALVLAAALMVGCGQAAVTTQATTTKAAGATTAAQTTAAQTTAKGKPIYFAWVGPLTGDAKQYGDTEKVAMELAKKKINAAGGILGRELVIEYFDDKNDATEAVTIANKIVGDKKFTAVVGHFSSTPSMAAAPIYEEGKIIMYSPTASHADFSKLGEYVFRNTPTQAIETAAYANYVYNKLNVRKVGILYVNDDWGNNITKVFTTEFTKLGGKIVATENFITGQTKDFTPMITKIKTADVEAFFPVAYYAESAQILIQADKLDFKKPIILSSSALKPELLSVAGKTAEGVFLMNAFSPDIDTARFKEVMAAYKTETGKDGDAFVMQPYDVVMQLAEAIKQTGSADSIPKIRDTLAGMKDYECLAGKYSMNEIGDAIRPLQAIKVIDGKFVNVTNK